MLRLLQFLSDSKSTIIEVQKSGELGRSISKQNNGYSFLLNYQNPEIHDELQIFNYKIFS